MPGLALLAVDAAHAEIFDDQIVLDPVLRSFPPHARFLHAAEGCDFGGDDAGVDADDSVFERLGDAPDAVDVAAVEVRREAEFGVVGEPDRFFFVLEAEEWRDRAEGLLLRYFHAGVDVGEDGGLEEGTAEGVALAAGQEFRAFGERVADVLFDFLHRGLVDERALHDAGLHAVADFHRLHLLGGLGIDKDKDLVLHEQAVRAHAGLAGVPVLGGERAFDRGIEVGVVEDDERRVAAELHGSLLHGLRALLEQYLADRGRPGECDFAHQGIGGHFAPDRGGAAGEHAEDTLWNSRALAQFSHRERRVRGRGRGFQDHGAARGERRARFAGDHGVGEIPRRDRRAHADRLLDDDDALVGLVSGNGVAVDALPFLREPLDEGGAVGDLGARLRERLALLGGEDLRQVFLVRHHQVEPFAKDHGALFRGLRAPGGKRGVRRLDRAACLRRAHVGHGPEDLAGGGVVDGNRLAAVGVGPFAVDVALLAKERRVLEIEGGDAGDLGIVHGRLRVETGKADAAANAEILPQTVRYFSIRYKSL